MYWYALSVGDLFKILTMNQMEIMVYVQRNEDFGDWKTIIMSPPLLIANPTTVSLFLLFNSIVQIEDRNWIPAFEKFIGWGHQELVYELPQGPLNMFVDCTFKTVPRGFHQVTKHMFPYFMC